MLSGTSGWFFTRRIVGCVQHFVYQWIIKVIVALDHRRGGVYPRPRSCGVFALYLVRCW